MSIRAEIQYRVQEKRLTRLGLTMGGTIARLLYLTEPVLALANGPWPDAKGAKRAGKVLALLESYVAGNEIVGRMHPSKNVHTVIALLEPAIEEVWEFRIGDPHPGVRVFGRFAEKDIFIATCWGYREQFDSDRAWRDYGIERCKNDWKNLFPAYDPFRGVEIHDYLSKARLPF